MPDKLPRFFFSYARMDCDSYLKTFFAELSKAVARKGALRQEKGEVSFRDIDSVEPGKDWESEIAEALAKCLTMVSIYSPWYFNRPYCGKEFQVFLERQPKVTFDASGAARDSEKVIPVLWASKKDLERSGLPPSVAQFIQFFIPKDYQEKYQEGLRLLRAKGKRGTYITILEELADIILDRANENPLTPMPVPPSFSAVQNAFAREPAPADLSDLGPDSMVLVYLTAGSMHPPASMLNRYGKHSTIWWPFDVEDGKNLDDVVRETVASLGFTHFVAPSYDLTKPSTDAQLIGDLQNATSRNVISVVFLDPWILNVPRGQQIRQAILMNKQWKGGLVVPIDAKDTETIALEPHMEQVRKELNSEQDRIVSSVSAGTRDDFVLAMLKLVTEIQGRIATTADVPVPFNGPGRSVAPALQGPSRRQ
jgi:hypothetical protein